MFKNHTIVPWIRLIPGPELMNTFEKEKHPDLCELFFHLIAFETPIEIQDEIFRSLMYQADVDYMNIPGLSIERFSRVTPNG